MVVLLTGLIGVLSADGSPDVPRLLLALGGMLGAQLAIGWTNDYFDRETDARHQPSKPVPSGLVDAGKLPAAALGAGVFAFVCASALGVETLALLIVGLSAGIAYNVRVKDTPWSFVPYIVAFAVLPAYVWAALEVFRNEYAWLYAFGAPLAIAVHLANTLPDLEADIAADRPGLVVSLGRQRSVLAVEVLLLIAGVLAAASRASDSAAASMLFLAALFFASVTGRAYAKSSRRQDVFAFRLVALAGIVLVGVWFSSVR